MGILLALALFAEPPWIETEEVDQRVQKKALDSTLKLRNPKTNGEGTAVRIKVDKDRVYYLTAAHNVKEGDLVELLAYPSDTYPKPRGAPIHAWVSFRADDSDLALLTSATIPEGPTEFVAISKTFSITNGEQPDRKAIMIGCKEGQPPQIWIESIEAERFVTKPDNARARFWVTNRNPGEGCSGGPLVNSKGELIGIVSGTATVAGSSDPKGFYVHLTEVQRFMRIQPILSLRTLGNHSGR